VGLDAYSVSDDGCDQTAPVLRWPATFSSMLRSDHRFPVPVIRIANRYRVPVAPILAALHLPAGDDGGVESSVLVWSPAERLFPRCRSGISASSSAMSASSA
jgi:hypothetical protein